MHWKHDPSIGKDPRHQHNLIKNYCSIEGVLRSCHTVLEFLVKYWCLCVFVKILHEKLCHYILCIPSRNSKKKQSPFRYNAFNINTQLIFNHNTQRDVTTGRFVLSINNNTSRWWITATSQPTDDEPEPWITGEMGNNISFRFPFSLLGANVRGGEKGAGGDPLSHEVTARCEATWELNATR